MPVFDTIETTLVKSWNFTPSRILRLVSRSIFVCKNYIAHDFIYLFTSVSINN